VSAWGIGRSGLLAGRPVPPPRACLTSTTVTIDGPQPPEACGVHQRVQAADTTKTWNAAGVLVVGAYDAVYLFKTVMGGATAPSRRKNPGPGLEGHPGVQTAW